MDILPMNTNDIECLAELDAQVRAGNESAKVINPPKVIRPWETEFSDMDWDNE